MSFVLGTAIGSFSNVCILRWIDNKSIIPNSHCYTCKTPIKWYDNIPIISYILLGGKCRHCHSTISLQYPFIEALSGFLFFAIFYQYGLSYMTLLLMFTTWFMLVATVTDIKARIIPNELIFAGLGMIAINLVFGTIGITEMLIGFVPAILLLILSVVLEIIMGVDVAVGGGDIKLLFILGGLWGWFLPVIVLVGGCYILLIVYGGIAIENFSNKKPTYIPMMIGFGLFFLYLLISSDFSQIQF